MKRKGTAMVLCLVLLAAMLPIQVQAEERAQIARSSDFIDDYNINFYSVGGGKVRIAFEVYATSVMDDVGATRIIEARTYYKVDGVAIGDLWLSIPSYL